MAAGGQSSELNHIWPHKSHFGSAFGSCSSDLDKIWHEHTTCPFKKACAGISHLMQNPRWPPGVKGPKLTEFDPRNHISVRHLDLVYQILTKLGMNILLDHTNKFAQEFIRFYQIFSLCQKSKMAVWGEMSNINQIWPQKSHFGSAIGSRSSNLNKIWHEHTFWSYKQIFARVIS